jgi:plasmid stabilization system protein ParE
MSFAITFSPAAIKDLDEAFEWYESRLSDGLAQKFIAELNNTFNKLAITPGIGSIRYENIRCTMVNKFPYIIHYSVNADVQEIIVYRIFCTYQKPLWED